MGVKKRPKWGLKEGQNEVKERVRDRGAGWK
jgi:hypothetical protein